MSDAVHDLPRLPVAGVFAATLRGAPCDAISSDDSARVLPVASWVHVADAGADADAGAGDRPLLAACVGTTIDIGCGPGRKSARLMLDHHVVLGIDIVPEAVARARARSGGAEARPLRPRPGRGALADRAGRRRQHRHRRRPGATAAPGAATARTARPCGGRTGGVRRGADHRHLVKLWTVYPHLFARPPRAARALISHGLERASIGVLVAAAVFQLVVGRGAMRLRLVIAAMGVLAAAYGAVMLVTQDGADLLDAALWLGGGVVLHDLVLAVPVLPVLGRFGARGDNPSLLDRPCAAGWLSLFTLVLLGVLGHVLTQRLRAAANSRRGDGSGPGR